MSLLERYIANAIWYTAYRRMIYLHCKHDIISVPFIREAYITCAADIIPVRVHHPFPQGTDIIEKTVDYRRRFFHVWFRHYRYFNKATFDNDISLMRYDIRLSPHDILASQVWYNIRSIHTRSVYHLRSRYHSVSYIIRFRRERISLQKPSMNVDGFCMAESVGFEPTVPCGITGFQDRLVKPLRQLSITWLL